MTEGSSLIGRRIGGRYEIVSQLGAGGMATAYLANDLHVSRQVVVKIPHEELIAQPDFRERFRREVRSLTELQYPGVVPLYDGGEDDGLPYCVVRYLPGGDLSDRLEATGGRLTVAEIIRWLPNIAETLDFVHRKGVIHRDVTPVNILFDDSGNAFLSDFGIAAISRSAEAMEAGEDPSRLTAEGHFVGAAVYVPPEAASRHLTPAYDQYSLALVLYHALCGMLPFPQVDGRSLLLAKNTEAPLPLRDRGVAIPAHTASAVMRALSIDPADRFGSCSEFADTFAGIGVKTLDLPTPEIPRRRGGGGGLGRMLGTGLILVVAVVAAGAWWLSRTNGGVLSPGTDGPQRLQGTTDIGTTEAELEQALGLCRAHGSSCPRSLYDDETLTRVTIGPIDLDETEVTNRAFADFVETTGYRTTAEKLGRSRDGPFEEGGLQWRRPAGPRSSHLDLPDHPVVHVSASDAEAYCEHHGARLPAEAEWEFAGRSADRRAFPWGSDWRPDHAAWASGENARLRAVGRFPAGPFGHLDLAGNVWEWTATHRGSGRVLRGGSWMETNPANLRAAVRLVAPPTDSSTDIGFRCARDVAQ